MAVLGGGGVVSACLWRWFCSLSLKRWSRMLQGTFWVLLDTPQYTGQPQKDAVTHQQLHSGGGMTSLSLTNMAWQHLGAPLVPECPARLGRDRRRQLKLRQTSHPRSLPVSGLKGPLSLLPSWAVGCHSCGQKHHLDRRFSGVGL